MNIETPRSPFDEIVDRRGTDCSKWDRMEALYGVSPEDGISMWVADMDFRAPDCVRRAIAAANDHGVFGYYAGDEKTHDATRWWMATRHGWDMGDAAIHTTNGLVNALALLLDTYTEKGDPIVVFAPVYHAFGRMIRAAGRELVELPLGMEDGRSVVDFDRCDALMTGREKMMIVCSPHNPTGRVWSADELRGYADFAARHDLILVSDEIHHDLVYPGHTHVPMPVAAPESLDRLVMLTAPSKTFNLAGQATGNVIIPDAALNAPFAQRMKELKIESNMFGMIMQAAAYSPEGAAWVDDLMRYLDGNRALFSEAIDGLPGARMSPLEATYLAWVDFSGTGMDDAEIKRRVAEDARIAASAGSTFGPGGEQCMRFNLAMPRARVAEAAERLADAFGDLQ